MWVDMWVEISVQIYIFMYIYDNNNAKTYRIDQYLTKWPKAVAITPNLTLIGRVFC